MENLRVHGSIFYLLKKFVLHRFPDNTWEILIESTDTNQDPFLLTENYPLEIINDILAKASEMTDLSKHDLMEQFGRYLVDDLFVLYSNYINLEWRTFDMILNTEAVMHGAVRKLNSTANPPILNVSRVNDKLLIIDYYSRRKMAALAIGIIKGIADYYNEADSVVITPTTDLDDHRVQLRLSFI